MKEPIAQLVRNRLSLLAALLACSGCATPMPTWPWEQWAPGYAQAERAARSSGRGMIVYYRTSDQGVSDPMFDALQSPSVRQRTRDFVTCLLFHSYEPDRRFVGQYGVQRAPALIVIHPDGTYHAQTGPQSSEQIEAFLDSAAPPGETPMRNAHLPRQPVYAWFASMESARAAAQRTGQSILVVLDRWYTRDWERLRPMLERREVRARFADMVHCRPAPLWGGAETVREEVGIVNLPAIAVIRPDGSHEAIELPNSYESIVRFADALKSGAPAGGNGLASDVGSDAAK